ncbi:hypothetical protein HALY111708_17190 [Halomonas lysinitropha]
MTALGEEGARQAGLHGGDDYELLLGLPPDHLDEARARLAALGLALTVIGRFSDRSGVQGVTVTGDRGWQHFSGGVAP